MNYTFDYRCLIDNTIGNTRRSFIQLPNHIRKRVHCTLGRINIPPYSYFTIT